MKRYKVNIPNLIKKKHAYIAHYIEINIKNGISEYSRCSDPRFEDIPKEWLELIKDGPISLREYLEPFINKEINPGKDPYCLSCWVLGQKQGFLAGEANDRKRTQPLIDAIKEYFIKDTGSYYQVKQALKTLEEDEDD
jgi:hypothetical protein